MDIRLSAAQSEVRARFAQLFDEELTPSIRRMGERPRTGAPTETEELRQIVWGALTDLGATRLLLPQRHGGEAAGQQGAVVLAEVLGGALYQGPLLDTLTATEVLATAEGAGGKLLERIAEGAPVVLAVRESGSETSTAAGPIELAGGRVIARRRFVNYAADAEYLCVIGADQGQPVCAVAARDDPAVSMRRQQDTGRGELYDVTLQGARVVTAPTGFAAAWPGLLAAARLRQAAYLVGMCQSALALAVQRAGTRRQFGQTIGRFQAPAFALAAAATRIESACWLVRATAWEADQGADIRLRSAQALAMAADLSRSTLAVAIQVHGAYGTTDQADIQLFYRRAAIERSWLGSPRALRAEVVPLLLAQRRADRFR